MAESFNSKKLKACSRINLSRPNRITELPDDILIHILSSLTIKEAGRTSLLAKRWRHLWAYVPTLNFDSSKILNVWSKEHKYYSWVDRVLSLHKATTIDEFRVRFGFKETRKDNIDNWLRFAMGKKVKRLQLDTKPIGQDSKLFSFTFPSPFLCNSLTSLELAYLDVTGEALEKLLYDCPALGFISIVSSKLLVDLKVAGPFLNLKSLRILKCYQMKKLEISAPNLLSFEYCGQILRSPFKSTPKLVEVTINGRYASHLLKNNLLDLSSCSSQIEVLTLNAVTKVIAEVFPVLPRLKVLELGISLYLPDEVFHLLYLIKACPSLHKLTIELLSQCNMRTGYARINLEPFCLNHLKFLEIREFVGGERDLKFATHLMESAIALEKITIIPTCMLSMDEGDIGRRTRARKLAKGLIANLKPGTKLEIR